MRDEEDMPAEAGEGMSTGKKVIAGAALGVAVPAAVGVARKLLSDDDSGDGGGGSRSSRSSRDTGSRSRATGTSSARSSGSRKTASRPKSSSSTRSRSATTARSSGGTARTKTREQLYRQATRLKIDGRSSMSKAQLERAVARAKAK